MSDAQTPVRCGDHGQTPSTFVCVHLAGGAGCGFHCDGDDPTDRWPDAWCDLCEAAFQREGEWNESNEPEIKLMCTGCYERARTRNIAIPAPIVAGQLSVSDEEFAELAHAACERCKVRQEEAKHEWPMFANHQRWFFAAETRTIRFFERPEAPALVADVTIAGSFSTKSNTWMWVWGNENYADAERMKLDPVRVFGDVRGIRRLAEAHWAAEEVDAWEVTQIAADLLGAEAIYRAPIDHMMMFMLLRGFRIEHPS